MLKLRFVYASSTVHLRFIYGSSTVHLKKWHILPALQKAEMHCIRLFRYSLKLIGI